MITFHLFQRDNHAVAALADIFHHTPVLRTLDPEFSLVSLGRVFLAHGLSIVEGLHRFKLTKPAYITDLGFGPPLHDIWVSPSLARHVVDELGIHELDELLAETLDGLFTLHDLQRHSLLHNWRLSLLSPGAYSTDNLLKTEFEVEHIEKRREKSQWIRTGIDEDQKEGTEQEDPLDKALLLYSSRMVEGYLHPDENANPSHPGPNDAQEEVINQMRNVLHITNQLPSDLRLIDTLDKAARLIRRKKPSTTSWPVRTRSRTTQLTDIGEDMVRALENVSTRIDTLEKQFVHVREEHKIVTENKVTQTTAPVFDREASRSRQTPAAGQKPQKPKHANAVDMPRPRKYAWAGWKASLLISFICLASVVYFWRR